MLLLASLVAGCASSAGTPAAQGGPCTAPVLGAQFHGLWSDYDDATREQVLEELAASGVRSVRLDVSWAALEPAQGSFDRTETARLDDVLDQIDAAGLEPVVMVWLTPAWANDGRGQRALPDDPASITGFARWAADRWRQVTAWQVWNEPNSEDFLVGADPVAYTALLQAAYPAFHEGNSAVRVVFGGTQYQDADWIEAAYRAGVRGSFDVMATHGYQAVGDEPPTSPDDGTPYRLTAVGRVHEVMAANGDGAVPIWFTEFGWSSFATRPGAEPLDRGVTRDQQAQYLISTLQELERRFPYVERAYWYNERDRATGDPRLDNYGLLERDGNPKPVATAAATWSGDCRA
ncbi:cellulase family glycosylhydrolase [Klenkia sp. LSe6-5]|uniref:Cellulase family glycosylhydrolase n=1 Tax=Klenkia sesuvii TaxID=3103137 RepID=A0ABU8DXI8_9ACTN